MQMDGYYIWEPTKDDGNPYSYRRVWVSSEPQPEPQRTRRLLPDSQHAEQHVVILGTTRRRESVGSPVAQWPLTMLHISAVILAIQIAAWFVLAVNGSPYRLVVLASMSQAGIVWFVAMAWSIKEMR